MHRNLATFIGGSVGTALLVASRRSGARRLKTTTSNTNTYAFFNQLFSRRRNKHMSTTDSN